MPVSRLLCIVLFSRATASFEFYTLSLHDALPIFERLFPRAYLDPTEEEAEADWQRFSHGDLLDGRRRALAAVEGTLASAEVRRGRHELTLSEEQALAWLSVINDARLALGTRLAVTEDMDLSCLDPDH